MKRAAASLLSLVRDDKVWLRSQVVPECDMALDVRRTGNIAV